MIKQYELRLNIYKRGEMNTRPIDRTVRIGAANPDTAREKARGMKYSSLADVVKIMRLRRVCD